jgi:hypothetical protein
VVPDLGYRRPHEDGDFAWPAYTDHRLSHIKLRVRARAAVLLYRQCTALNVAGFDPKLVAQIIDLTRSAVTCDRVRAEMRRAGIGRTWIRRAHLVEDVRFKANHEGFVDQFELRTDLPARETTSGGSPDPIDCPAQTVGILRTTGPEPVRGDLETVSAAREGVSAGIVFPRTLVHEALVGSTGGPCHYRATGAETLVPRLVGGFRGAAFDPTPGYDAPPLPSIVRFRSAGRFGRSFTISRRESVQEPLANGTWMTSGPVELQFDLCDRGGRRPSGC